MTILLHWVVPYYRYRNIAILILKHANDGNLWNILILIWLNLISEFDVRLLDHMYNGKFMSRKKIPPANYYCSWKLSWSFCMWLSIIVHRNSQIPYIVPYTGEYKQQNKQTTIFFEMYRCCIQSWYLPTDKERVCRFEIIIRLHIVLSSILTIPRQNKYKFSMAFW